jgi:1,5-anhydro-D-fructose reductase (1,5-anhydro-D-mannitol-forming)
MRWGLIGASNIAGEWMVGALRAVGDEIVAVVSGSDERARAFALQHGIAHALTREADLADLGIDAVYVSSTNEKHEASVLHAAFRGWHVLCEKPVATTLEAARRMVDACAAAGVVMGTNHHLRHNAAHRRMRELIDEGRLGRLVAARVHHAVYLRPLLQGWRLHDRAAGGGVVLDIAVHNADSLAFLLGEYPVEVQAMVASTGLAQGMEDHAMSLWRFASGLTAFTHQAFTTPHARVGLEIHGTEGTLEGDGILNQRADGSLLLRTAAGAEPQDLDRGNLYERCLQQFHGAVRGEPNTLADGRAGLRSLAVALAVLDSAQQGRAVRVDLGD